MKKTLIVAATPDLEKSKNFYHKLGFEHFESDGMFYVRDGAYLIHLDDKKSSRNGIKIYKENWAKEVEVIRKWTPVKERAGGYTFNCASGIRIQLELGQGIGVADARESTSLLGNIAGLSLEGITIASINRIYKVLGFQKTMGDENGSWLTVSNEDDFGISMMGEGVCPHMFYNPSLTYFNGKNNLSIIKKLREKEIHFTEEITTFNKEGIVDNVIIRDPSGIGFFIFSD